MLRPIELEFCWYCDKSPMIARFKVEGKSKENKGIDTMTYVCKQCVPKAKSDMLEPIKVRQVKTRVDGK